MIKSRFSVLVKVILPFLLALVQPHVQTVSAHASVIGVGQDIDGMLLTTGAADARPLWAFCVTRVNGNVTTADCQVPQISKLSIGHLFLDQAKVLRGKAWPDLEWELYLDDQLIDLNDFGTYDYVQPSLAPPPSRVREVHMKYTAWDIVLANLQPGAHTLDGRVRADGEDYTWNVSLVIEAPSTELSSDGGLSRCPKNMSGRSPFHTSCRLYAMDPKTGF